MKKSILTTITIFFSCVLLTISAHSSSIGESAGEIWIDGPDQPGSDPNQPDADVDSTGRTIFVWDAFTANRKDIFLRDFPADGSDQLEPVQVNT